MRILRGLLRRVPILIGLLISLTGFAFSNVLGLKCLSTGVAAGRFGARYLRADGDPFYYVTVSVFGIGSLFWLGLAIIAVVVLIRWRTWP